jgi:hypothetical protein
MPPTLLLKAKYAANYPKPFRIDYIIGVPTSSNNIITKDNLLSLMDIHDQVEAASVTVEDADWDLNSLCFQLPGDGHPCMINSVLQYWDYDKATLESDSDIQLTLKNDATEADLKSFLSDFSTDPATGDYSASGAKITYFLENRQVVVKGDYQDLPATEWEGKFLEIGETCTSGLTCYRFAERSFSDEFGGAIGGDIVLMNIGFLIIIIYLCFNLGKCGDKVRMPTTPRDRAHAFKTTNPKFRSVLLCADFLPSCPLNDVCSCRRYEYRCFYGALADV